MSACSRSPVGCHALLSSCLRACHFQFGRQLVQSFEVINWSLASNTVRGILEWKEHHLRPTSKKITKRSKKDNLPIQDYCNSVYLSSVEHLVSFHINLFMYLFNHNYQFNSQPQPSTSSFTSSSSTQIQQTIFDLSTPTTQPSPSSSMTWTAKQLDHMVSIALKDGCKKKCKPHILYINVPMHR